MNVSAPPDAPYTILRIKRKRNEEPLDALVIESALPRKKTKGGKGIFQFAQTVEDTAWQDEKQQREIQERISRLASAVPNNNLTDASGSTVLPPSSAKAPQTSEMSRRYTVVERERIQSQWNPNMPPPVLSAKELQAQKASVDFKMYDAVLDQEEPEVDPEIEKIMPLLQSYLKSKSLARVYRLIFNSTLHAVSNIDPEPATNDDTDYVWDIFYHRPGARQDWTQTIGTIAGLPHLNNPETDSESDEEVEDNADEDSNAEEYYKNDYPDEEDSDWNSDDDFDQHSDFFGDDGSGEEYWRG